MQYRNDEQRLLVGCISDQVLAYDLEPQIARCEIGPRMALPRERNETQRRLVNFRENAVSGIQTVFSNNSQIVSRSEEASG